jgi:hypothetical protein
VYLFERKGQAWAQTATLKTPVPQSSGPWVTYEGGNVYWNGGIGTGEFVVKFGCQ